MRDCAKEAIFGLAYGSNINTFSKTLKLSVSDGRKALGNYQDKCPEIAGFCRSKIGEIKKNGYISVKDRRFLRAAEFYTMEYSLVQEKKPLKKRGFEKNSFLFHQQHLLCLNKITGFYPIYVCPT